MKKYPSISRDIIYGKPFYCFDKLDGSNIRVEWSKKNGFYKFGKRNGLLDDSNPILKNSIDVFNNKYSNDLNNIFRKQKYQNVICYLEFFGENSFAGNHDEKDNFDLKLFDLSVDKKGFLSPQEFLKIFKNIEIANLLYYGNITKDFIFKVQSGELENMTFEGVVCKNKAKTPGLNQMFKIKNQNWIDKLKNNTSSEEEFQKLL